MKQSELNESTFISSLNGFQINDVSKNSNNDFKKYLHLNLKCKKQENLYYLCQNKNCTE
jgi:hypothetical protein